MQSYSNIPETTTLTASRTMLLNDILTALSSSSGSSFPTTNLQLGMLCYRTDLMKLYVLKDLTPTWWMVADLSIDYTSTPVGGGTSIDANAISRSGFYHCSANIPTNDGENDKAVIHSQYGASALWATQIAQSWRNGRIWIRNKTNGTWGGWFEAITANSGTQTGTSVDKLDGFDTSSTGNRWGVIPVVGDDGVMEVGKYIDFHNSDADAGDYLVRLTASTSSDGTSVLLLNDKQIPVMNGIQQTGLNAEKVGGYSAGSFVRSVGGAAPDTSGNVAIDLSGYLAKSGGSMSGNLTVAGDIQAHRGNETGVIYLGASGNRYVYFDGSNYRMPNGELYVNGSGSRVARANETAKSIGLPVSHLDQGGNIAGSKRLVTATDGVTTWWIYDKNSSNCNCNCACCGGTCFVAGTKVWTPDGQRAIENISVGDMVVAPEGVTKVIFVWSPLVGSRDLWEINGDITFTGDHVFKLANGKFAVVDPASYSSKKEGILISSWNGSAKMGLIPVSELEILGVGAVMAGINENIIVETIKKVRRPPMERVYQIFTESGTYFVERGYVSEAQAELMGE